jgi:hypothetical protein
MIEFPLIIRLSGVSFNNAQDNIKTFAKPEIRWFAMVREPENPHDPNAIRVALFGEFFLGYIPKDVAAHLAPLMDAGRVFDAEYVYVAKHPFHNMVGLSVKIVEAPSPSERRSEIWKGGAEHGA